jgi:nitrogen regulatory protein P-II 1
MKKLSIVVHTSVQEELADCLRSLKLQSFMFTHIEEHSSQLKQDAFLSARDKVVGYVPKVQVDILLEDERAKTLLDELRGSGIAFAGKGVYWVCDVDEVGEL